MFLVLVLARWRAGWVLVPLGLGLLAAYSLAIEYTQLQVARIDRACDVTDIIDNVTGAADRGRDRPAPAAAVPPLAGQTVPQRRG